jgi:hypothetical protein
MNIACLKNPMNSEGQRFNFTEFKIKGVSPGRTTNANKPL